jgi:hypothetical protein
MENENKRYFSVSEVNLNAAGRATHVLWSEINAKSNGNVSAPVVVPVADVVDAIHDGAHVAAVLLPPHTHLPDRVFEVIAHWDGSETIDLVRPAGSGTEPVIELKDLASLDISTPMIGESERVAAREPQRLLGIHTPRTFAVSKVKLDDDGRVTAVFWGKVDTIKNAWAEPEALAPVAAVVAALQAGDQVFALFPSVHGHLPDRRFAQADYDGGRQTIVLVGPTAHDREIHDMDRITVASQSTRH